MVTPPLPAEFQALLDRQFGLVTQAQLTPHGYPRSRIRRHLEAGRWQWVLRGVYAVTNGPLSRDMILMAAVLFGGGATILSHHTAAEEWGMIPLDPIRPVHITVPRGLSTKGQAPTRVRSGTVPVPNHGAPLHPGVIVHRSKAHAYIGVDTNPPRTSRADTALDLATAAPTAADGYASLIATVTNGGIRLSEIRKRMQQRRPYRYVKALDSAVTLLADGVQSVLEAAFADDVEVAHALPSAHRQGPVSVDGRTLYEDCVYDVAGRQLIVRLDGRRVHAMREVAFRDRRRDNAAELAGRARLVYGFQEVDRTPCEVAAEIATVLERMGWVRTKAPRCPSCVVSFRTA
ncbi:type IV toxin-antitoxin system AbiEi family antitoxin domain-containing protein [Rhodococcus sp. 2H158]